MSILSPIPSPIPLPFRSRREAKIKENVRRGVEILKEFISAEEKIIDELNSQTMKELREIKYKKVRQRGLNSQTMARKRQEKQEPLRRILLLQEWAYERAVEQRFNPEKIILIHPQKERSSNYYEIRNCLKYLLKIFPKNPIEIEVEFPKDDDHDFHEIDLAIRFNKYLFLLEVKGTKATNGWITHVQRAKIFNERMKSLQKKADILIDNLKKGKIHHPFLLGVKKYILQRLITEGTSAKPGVMTPIEYIQFLKTVREQWDKGTLDEYLDSVKLL